MNKVLSPDAYIYGGPPYEQELPLPDLGSGSSAGLRGNAVFTRDGRYLLIGAPNASRHHEGEGAVLVYKAQEDGRFSREPRYFTNGIPHEGFGRELVLSGNDRVLAVSGTGAGIRVHDFVNGELRPTQLIELPDDFGRFATGFSLSYDGSTLLSGPFSCHVHKSDTSASDIAVASYRRKNGQYEIDRFISLESMYGESSHASVALSPDGRHVVGSQKDGDQVERGARIKPGIYFYSMPSE